MDLIADDLLALLYRDQNEHGDPSGKARVGAMHVAEAMDHIRALRTAYVKSKP
jgi:hypothetical protein